MAESHDRLRNRLKKLQFLLDAVTAGRHSLQPHGNHRTPCPARPRGGLVSQSTSTRFEGGAGLPRRQEARTGCSKLTTRPR